MLIFTLAVVFYDIFKFQEEKKKFRGYPDDSRWQILKSSNIYFNYFTSWHSIHAETFADTGNFSLEMVYIYIYMYIIIQHIFRGSFEYRKERHFVIYTQYPVAALNHCEWISRSSGMSTCCGPTLDTCLVMIASRFGLLRKIRSRYEYSLPWAIFVPVWPFRRQFLPSCATRHKRCFDLKTNTGL